MKGTAYSFLQSNLVKAGWRIFAGGLANITSLLFATSVKAQITPAANDAGTIVNQSSNTFNIEGGTQAGVNLFHSFEKFGLNQGQIANFLSNPSIQNILGRVTGGDASVINGLIQVTGGNSNLFLMNPAGIIFGPNASLNVPAAFTATTANGIGIGDSWFKAMGTNDYTSLVGSPSAFAFTQPGTIFNAGKLAVGSGQKLTLLGGTVINTGTLSAPGGNITIAAVPGENLVRISQAGSLLSLELPLETKAAIDSEPFTPLSLPQLLTGGNLSGATGVTVENGEVKLTSSGVAIPNTPGTVVVTNEVNVSGAIGGTVNVLGTQVSFVDANIYSSDIIKGSAFFVGDDYTVLDAQYNVVYEDFNSSAFFVGGDYIEQGTVLDAQYTVVYGDFKIPLPPSKIPFSSIQNLFITNNDTPPSSIQDKPLNIVIFPTNGIDGIENTIPPISMEDTPLDTNEPSTPLVPSIRDPSTQPTVVNPPQKGNDPISPNNQPPSSRPDRPLDSNKPFAPRNSQIPPSQPPVNNPTVGSATNDGNNHNQPHTPQQTVQRQPQPPINDSTVGSATNDGNNHNQPHTPQQTVQQQPQPPINDSTVGSATNGSNNHNQPHTPQQTAQPQLNSQINSSTCNSITVAIAPEPTGSRTADLFSATVSSSPADASNFCSQTNDSDEAQIMQILGETP